MLLLLNLLIMDLVFSLECIISMFSVEKMPLLVSSKLLSTQWSLVNHLAVPPRISCLSQLWNFPKNILNKPGTAQVGATSKAQ